MNKKILEQVHAPDGVVALSKRNPEKIAKIAKLKIKFDRLEILSLELKGWLEIYDNVRNGATATKSEARTNLEMQLLADGGALYVYGMDNGLNDVKEASALSETLVCYMRDAELGHLGQVIARQLKEIGQPMEEYGMTAELVQKLQAASDTFAEATTATGQALSDKKGAMREIETELEEVDALQLGIDKLMLQFAISDPGFYTTYKEASKAHHYAVRHRKNGENDTPADNTTNGSDVRSK